MRSSAGRRRIAVIGPALIAAAVVVGPPTAASGQERGGRGVAGGGEFGRRAEEGPTDFYLMLGVIGGLAPDYPGSDDYEPIPAPYIRAEYRDLVFLHGRRLGANVLRLGSRRDGLALRAGPVVRPDLGRDEDDNDALEGLGDVDPGLEAGAFAEVAYLFAAFRAQVFQEVADGHDGLLVDLTLESNLPLTDRLRLDTEIGMLWADDAYMSSYFGISDRQAARSGLPAFNADSGFRSVGAALGLVYAPTDSWRVRAQTAYGRLLGDAADSPIVDDAGSPNQFFVGLGVAYEFGF